MLNLERKRDWTRTSKLLKDISEVHRILGLFLIWLLLYICIAHKLTLSLYGFHSLKISPLNTIFTQFCGNSFKDENKG